MSIQLPARVPRRLLDWLNGAEPQSTAIPLVTIDEVGFPHIAILSWFEVIAVEAEICFFLREGTHSAGNLLKRPATLLLITPEFVLYLKGRAALLFSQFGHDVFRFDLHAVLKDHPAVEESGTRITSAISFRDDLPVRRERLRLRRKLAEKCRIAKDG